MNSIKIIFFKLFLLLTCSLGSLGHTNAAQTDTTVLSPFRYQGFVNQFDKALTPADIAHKYVLVNFIFTDCIATCPIQTAQMAAFQKHLSADLQDKLYIISISVNPAKDSPKTLREYAQKFKANLKSWSFLSGEPAAFERLRNEFVAIKPSQDGSTADFNFHSTDVSLFDAQGRFIQRYQGAPLNHERLLEDIRTLINIEKQS